MGSEAFEVFHPMPPHLIDEGTYACRPDASFHSGFVDEAEEIVKTTKQKSVKIYTALVRQIESSLFDSRATVCRSIAPVCSSAQLYHPSHHAMHRQSNAHSERLMLIRLFRGTSV